MANEYKMIRQKVFLEENKQTDRDTEIQKFRQIYELYCISRMMHVNIIYSCVQRLSARGKRGVKKGKIDR